MAGFATKCVALLGLLTLVACNGGNDDGSKPPVVDMGPPPECTVVEPCEGDSCPDAGSSDVGTAIDADAGGGCEVEEICVEGFCEPDPDFYRDPECEAEMETTILGETVIPWRVSPEGEEVAATSRVVPGGDHLLGLFMPIEGDGKLMATVTTLDPPVVSDVIEVGRTAPGAFRGVWMGDAWLVVFGEPDVGLVARLVSPDLTQGEAIEIGPDPAAPSAVARIREEAAIHQGVETLIVDTTAEPMEVAQRVQPEFGHPPGLTAWQGKFVWAGIDQQNLKVVMGLGGERSEKTWPVEWANGTVGGSGTARAGVVGDRLHVLLQARRGASGIEVSTLSADLGKPDGDRLTQTLLSEWALPEPTSEWLQETSIVAGASDPFAAIYTQNQGERATAIYKLGDVLQGPDAAETCTPCAAIGTLGAADGTVAAGWSSFDGGVACAALIARE